MRTLGIDLAAQDKNTAACEIEWGDGRATVTTLVKGIGDPALLDAMCQADWTGIDAPFGWPEHFLAATAAFTKDGTWPAEPDKDYLRYRETDRAVQKAVKVNPLSVSSDRIAACAWRCAGLLSEHAQKTSWTLDRLGEDGVAEVYPAAALTRWGLNAKGYKKGGPGEETAQAVVRRRIADDVRTAMPWLTLDDDKAEACVRDDDVLDALVSSLVARAAATGRTVAAPENTRQVAAREGWIHVPCEGSLPELAQSASSRST
jgi:predicted nuclease with RNAse H fold